VGTFFSTANSKGDRGGEEKMRQRHSYYQWFPSDDYRRALLWTRERYTLVSHFLEHQDFSRVCEDCCPAISLIRRLGKAATIHR
jgi:hypothetical protein